MVREERPRQNPGALLQKVAEGNLRTLCRHWGATQRGGGHEARATSWPTGRESHGHGVPIVLVGVTPHQGTRESRAQGEVAQVVGCPEPVRYARCGTPKQVWLLCKRCSQEATGELLEIERLTSSLERGHWKSTCQGNSLVAYSTASPVLNGGEEETCMLQRALSLSNCLAPASGRRSGPAFGLQPQYV